MTCSLKDPFMLILVTIKEGNPGVTCYTSPFACILTDFAQKKIATECCLRW